MTAKRKVESSASIQDRVIRAKDIQQERFKRYSGIYTNAMMPSAMVKDICCISKVGQNLLKTAMEKLVLSGRAYNRILKVARTIADLANSETIQENYLAEAIHYRSLDRQSWGT